VVCPVERHLESIEVVPRLEQIRWRAVVGRRILGSMMRALTLILKGRHDGEPVRWCAPDKRIGYQPGFGRSARR